MLERLLNEDKLGPKLTWDMIINIFGMYDKKVYYEATALINYTDSYGEAVIKKGDRCIIKKPNLNVYKETGRAYFKVKNMGL